jgi:hypothetical protein
MTSQDPIPSMFSDRLERLEGESTWIKRIGLAASLLATCVFIVGQARPTRIVDADKFVLRDSSGRMRASLGMVLNGPSLNLYDADGKSRVELGALPGQTALLIMDEKGKMRAALGSGGDHQALTISDVTGSERVVVDVNGNRPGLVFLDAKTSVIWSAPNSSQASDLAGSKPRVFLEVWSGSPIFKFQRKTEPLDEEMAAFGRACPQALVMSEQQDADYTLRLSHHQPGGTALRLQNPPADYDRDFYRWSLIRKEGDVVDTGSNDSLAGAIQQACTVLVKNRARN